MKFFKTLFLTSLTLVLSLAIKAQEIPEIESEPEMVFTIVEEMPSFPGGEEAMRAFISENLNCSTAALNPTKKHAVFASFLVREDGSISKIKILRGVSEECDKAAKETIAKFPTWIPGKQRGKLVTVQMTIGMPLRVGH